MTASHPEPPKNFRSVRLLIRLFPLGTTWWRIHRSAHNPIYFGKSGANRFDAPSGEFGVLYIAGDAHGAFIETFGHATGIRAVTESELEARRLSCVYTSRHLRLVDLRGEGLARMGADAMLTGGADYALAQRWALAIHDHPRIPDGILYRARHDPARLSAALFERTSPLLTARLGGHLMAQSQRDRLADILDTYKFGLLP